MSGEKKAKLIINILILISSIITVSTYLNWINKTASLNTLGIWSGITAILIALRVLVKDALS